MRDTNNNCVVKGSESTATCYMDYTEYMDCTEWLHHSLGDLSFSICEASHQNNHILCVVD